jgi:hypothetical protein
MICSYSTFEPRPFRLSLPEREPEPALVVLAVLQAGSRASATVQMSIASRVRIALRAALNMVAFFSMASFREWN